MIKDSNPKSKKVKFPLPDGWRDLLPDKALGYNVIRAMIRGILEPHGYENIELSIAEDRDLCLKYYGKNSPIAQKGLVPVGKRSGGSAVLRPDLRLGMLRSYVENDLGGESQPVKIYASGSVYRNDFPGELAVLALGVLGNERPATDAEVIQLAYRVIERLKLDEFTEIHLNSVGCNECWPGYRQTLKDYYRSHRQKLCAECRKNFTDDPRKLLTCPEEKCQRFALGAPPAVDSLCDSCKKHLQGLLEVLDELQIPYILDNRLVGEDFNNRSVAKIVAKADKPETLVEIGRQDSFLKIMGSPALGAVGAQFQIEAILKLLAENNLKVVDPGKPRVFLAQLGELAKKKSMKLFEQIYTAGIPLYEAFGRDSLKSQIRLAQKLEVDIMLILGQKEAGDETILLREMQDGVQEVVPQDKLVDIIKKRLAVK